MSNIDEIDYKYKQRFKAFLTGMEWKKVDEFVEEYGEADMFIFGAHVAAIIKHINDEE